MEPPARSRAPCRRCTSVKTGRSHGVGVLVRPPDREDGRAEGGSAWLPADVFSADRDRRHDQHRWLLFLVCFAMLIVSLDQYIVVVALPDIGRALGYSVHTLQLVVSAYAVASSGFLLLGGRAVDLLGQRRILATGLVLYAVASFAGGVGHRPGDPARCPGGAGNGWSVGVSGDPGCDHHRLPAGVRPQPRAGDVGCSRGGRAGGGRAGRRPAHPLPRVVGSVLRQRAARPRSVGGRVRRRPEGSATRPDPPVRPDRCSGRDVGGDTGGLGPGTRPGSGLERSTGLRPGRPGPALRLGVHQS